MNMKKLFLPVGLCLAALCALFIPGPGVWMKSHYCVPILVSVIFLICGSQLKLKEVKPDKNFLLVFILGAIISLGIGIFVGLAMSKLFFLSTLLAFGLIVMASVPPTLSSGIVITEICGGNIVIALLLTVGLNFVGIFTVPFMLKLCVSHLSDIDIPAIILLKKLLLLVLLPFITALVLRRFTLKPLAKIPQNYQIVWKNFAKYTPSSCVILIVFAGFAASRQHLMQTTGGQLLLVTGAAISMHFILLLISFITAKVFKLQAADGKALLFVASQKTLPIAASIIASLDERFGAALIPCLVLHFSQLVIDSALASFMHKKSFPACEVKENELNLQGQGN